jgi:hypothetical protein
MGQHRNAGNKAGSGRAAVKGIADVENVLYYGDNLEILRRYVKDESVDLVCRR